MLVAKHKIKYALVGGDRRNVAIAQQLHAQGHEVTLFGFDLLDTVPFMHCKNLEKVLADADVIVTPARNTTTDGWLYAPWCKTTVRLADIASLIKSGQILIAGEVDFSWSQNATN